MACLLELSHELLHCVLTYVEPADLAALSRSCGAFNEYIKGNKLLCKNLYLQRFDHPVESDAGEEPCWETELRKLTALEKLLSTENVEAKRENLELIATAILPLLQTPTSDLNIAWLTSHFANKANLDNILAASSIFGKAGSRDQTPAATPELQQLSARLHCLYGVPIDTPPSKCPLSYTNPSLRLLSLHHILYPNSTESPASYHAHMTRARDANSPVPTHSYARARVYDLRRYTDGSFWGPFKDDGSGDVDWEKVEAVMVVLGYNLKRYVEKSNGCVEDVWDTPWRGVGPHSYVSLPCARPDPTRELGAPGDLESRDPYGVTGLWMRIVCFLDYNDLYAFNFAHTHWPADRERDPIDTEEAIRLIKLKLQVTKIEPPGEDDGQGLPVVTFKGTSKSMHASWDPNANSRIRGTVRQTPQGEIRWTTFSIFHGEERWRSEGVQIGGIRSARGILGNWFDKDYDIHGPAGPTAFWKLSDEKADERTNDRSTPSLYAAFPMGGDDDDDVDDDDWVDEG